MKTLFGILLMMALASAAAWGHTQPNSPKTAARAAFSQPAEAHTPDGGAAMRIQVSSKSFPAGGDIPRKFTCDGADVSPELSWGELPADTRALALIGDDPDAPVGTFTHWVLYDLPATTRGLPEGVPKAGNVPGGGRQGRNDFGRPGYGGPCPPPGKPHRYFFRVYALDSPLNLKPGASRNEVQRAMQGHVLGEGEVLGRYGR